MLVPLKLVTIVAEEVLAQHLIDEIRKLGASGYTTSEARGSGARGVRHGRVGEVNVRIETVVGTEVAARIMEMLAERYFPNHATIAWVADVEVVRGDKYV